VILPNHLHAVLTLPVDGGKKVPRLQILTAAQVLENRRTQFGHTEGFRKAAREDEGAQGQLL
jgi:site-specific DNA-methyltransferase (adenine-specific)